MTATESQGSVMVFPVNDTAKARELRKTPYFQELLRKGICHYCGGHFKKEELTLDHIVPVARGGRSTRGNLVVCCKSCNNSKSCLTPAEQLLNLLGDPEPEPVIDEEIDLPDDF